MSNLYDNNSHELQDPAIVVRDSLGYLAVQILAAQDGFKDMSNEERVSFLYDTISNLHAVYDDRHY